MDRGNILSGNAFSAVLMSAAVFLFVLMAVGLLMDSYVKDSVIQDLRADVEAQWNLFSADYHSQGLGPLTDLIDSAVMFPASGQRAFGLFDSQGQPLAGNIVTKPKVAGRQQAALQATGAQRGIDYVYRSDRLDGYTLVIGQRMDRMVQTRHAVFRTLATTGFVVVLTMLAVGYHLSSKSQRKLELLETTLARVSDGDMTARMVLSTDKDQIDRIAARMNAHLDTLARLMTLTRATAAAIAHDLKSPLTRAYMGLGRALAQVEAGHDPHPEIADTQAELERMNAIFDSFLRLSRIEAGADNAVFTDVDLGVLLDDLVETYQLMAEDHGQNLRYIRAPHLRFWIKGDAPMVQQITANLLQNAITHGHQGNEICLGLAHVATGIRLTVSDTGPGIPDSAREAVFQPFHRLDPNRSTLGSGLGLALVRAICDRHHARIALSDNAPGLTVTIDFDAVVPGRYLKKL